MYVRMKDFLGFSLVVFCGCSPPNDELQQLPDLRPPAIVKPVISKQVDIPRILPEITDESLAIILKSGQPVDSCRRGEKISLRYQFRRSQPSLSRDSTFPEKNDRILLTFSIKTPDGKVIIGNSKVVSIVKQKSGIYVASANMIAPPMAPNGRPTRPGWFLRATLLKDDRGHAAVVMEERPVTLIDSVTVHSQ